MIYDLGEQHSLVQHWVRELRDVNVQQDRMRFRRNLQRIAEVAAYELSKQLEWQKIDVQTPLTTATAYEMKAEPVIVSILRAGVPMHQGLLNYFDHADNGFISAYRKHDEEGNFVIKVEYISTPPFDGKVLILADPMLATGSSMELTLEELHKIATPKEVHLVCAIAAQPGIEMVHRNFPDVRIWTGAIDPELNSKSYIVPGLGDAGDLAFGSKVQA